MKRVGRWLAALVVLIAAMALIATAIGASLPADHTATRSVVIRAPADSLWAAIANYPAQAAWRRDVKEVVRVENRGGREVWQETYKSGETMRLETTESSPPARLVRTIADVGGPFSGRWEYQLAPDRLGTRVTITEHGMVPNPFFRFVSHYIIGQTSAMEQFLHELAARMGSAAAVVQ